MISSMEIPPGETTFEIDTDTFEQIDELVLQVKTRYSTWYEFVDEAVRVFATWWDNPEDAWQIMKKELWPHLTQKQHNIMKDPKFGGIKIYEDARKEAEEYLIENKIPLVAPENEVDTEFRNNAMRELKKVGYLRYTIKIRRVQQIKEILKTAKSSRGVPFYQKFDDFMEHTIKLWMNFWKNPYSNEREMYGMFPCFTM